VISLVGMYVYRRSRLGIGLDGFLFGVNRVGICTPTTCWYWEKEVHCGTCFGSLDGSGVDVDCEVLSNSLASSIKRS
jgi:hypothetical protein